MPVFTIKLKCSFNKLLILVPTFCLALVGCDLQVEKPSLHENGYVIPLNTTLVLELQTNLSSNTNQRGDTFSAHLTKPLKANGSILLPENTIVNGLVKRATKYERFGDKSSLLLLFDQLEHPNGFKIPIVATLDTDKGGSAIKIKGKAIEDAKVIVGAGVIAGLMGGAINENKESDQVSTSVLIGATIGAGAVMYSNMKEINLPVGTEISIQIEKSFFIPNTDGASPETSKN